MARALYDDVVEYEDGTPATTSQMAKDVVTFLSWASEPIMEERKVMMTKALGIALGLTGCFYYLYRHRWAPIRNAVVMYRQIVKK